MADEPRGMMDRVWRVSLTILGVIFVLWLSLRLLAQIWWMLVIIGSLAAVVYVAIKWWQWRHW